MKTNNIKNVKIYDPIDLVEVLNVFLKKWFFIVIAGILGFVLAFGYTKLTVSPTYASSFTAYLNNYTSQDILNYISNGDLYTRTSLANTAAGIAKSVEVKKKVAEEMDINPQGIGINTYVDDSCGILTIRIIMHDKSMVTPVAEKFAEVLSTETTRIIQGSSLQIIDTPVEPSGRYAPNYFNSGVKGALVGVVLVCGIIFLFYMLDDKIKSVDKLQKEYDIPVLGVIPDLSASNNKKNGYYKGYYKKQ